MVVSMMTSHNPPFVSDDPLSSYLRDRSSDPSVDLRVFFLFAFCSCPSWITASVWFLLIEN